MLKRLVITGYKQHELGIFDEQHPGIQFIKKALNKRLSTLLDEGLEWVILSGQLGVETWAAEVVIELKKEYPQLKYAVITPFLDQEKNWNDTRKENYHSIVAKADYQISLTKKPYEAPWQFIEKDKFFMRNSDGILIVYDEENEGSPKFVKKAAERYAENSDYQVLTITADDLQAIMEEEQWAASFQMPE
ncbi:SLOG family protein [Sporosarcina limicola]|uniref:SLOG family protein n=1 Tax=Sporosarcina limicola TaxID=34101 RepID=UPI00178AB537